jgi:hypothetical protein
VVISLGTSQETLDQYFETVYAAGEVVSPYAMPWETNLTIYVCLGLKVPLSDLWARSKLYI